MIPGPAQGMKKPSPHATAARKAAENAMAVFFLSAQLEVNAGGESMHELRADGAIEDEETAPSSDIVLPRDLPE